jgi:hypothetical protein
MNRRESIILHVAVKAHCSLKLAECVLEAEAWDVQTAIQSIRAIVR